ncbi:MAG TPA: helix-turn-helix transcriptional regulator [Alloprevotella sp.]|jgi:transcriptional regulator with XRE-family HTH domain|uniref:HTH-type transcriptional regulator DdrOC n=1 Tax=Bacteroides acidifaciens TaxID=85831 RepID=A0A7J0A5F8_9BACE|nr:helix-turn-helix transcriptional regulator [Bacteroides acidifaciens]GFH87645.1 HTH-type transcriptional regulator DdrOC [Bacteroides acidifaciens]HRF85985.1 helix-turn-helix transcriptional regulator [Alloprevotella sp.]
MSKELANRVKEICSEKGLQMKDLAAIMNVKPESLSRTLNGNPQLSSLENIAKALNIGIADLFADKVENNIIFSSTTPNSLTSIIVYKDKTYIANTLNELLSHVRMICDE